MGGGAAAAYGETVRAQLGKFASRFYPNLDEVIWNRERDRVMRAEISAANCPPFLAGPPELATDRPSHLVVVPHEGPTWDSYRAGTRNFYYEAAQSAREIYGADKVTVFDVAKGESAASWHKRLIWHVSEVNATHIITHIESDPSSASESWSWDILWAQLSPQWDGVLLGVMFDSAYRYITLKSRRLARMSPNFMVVDICMPMDGSMRRDRPEVGPINMPLSLESLQLVDERLQGIEPTHDVSFIGVLYPYRAALLENLVNSGLSVAVNPHRVDHGGLGNDGRADQPGWLDYMAALRGSRMTINFSQSSAGPYEQLKTRVLEATLAGTLLLTDDRDRTRLFFKEGEEYGYFDSPQSLVGVVRGYLEDPQLLKQVAAAGHQRARALASTSFWGGIEEGLRQRGLPPLS